MAEQFHRPATVQEALGLKRRFRTRAAFLAGGTLANAKGSPLHPEHWISLEGLKLDRIDQKRGDLIVGAFCSLQRLIEEARTPEPLRAAAAQIVSRNVRNMATIGGHVGANLPSSDLIPMLVALEAQVELPGLRAAKTISIMDYITAGTTPGITTGVASGSASGATPRGTSGVASGVTLGSTSGCTSACAPGCGSTGARGCAQGCAPGCTSGVSSTVTSGTNRLITRIIIPRSDPNRAAACGNIRGSSNARSLLSAAVSLTWAEDHIQEPIIALAGVARHVVRLTSAEEALDGKPLPSIDKLAAMISRCVRPTSTPFASAAYIKHQAGVVVALAFHKALRPEGDRG